MKKYIPLHVHSMYSLLDGLSKPEQIADRCEEIGVKSCALTDHGNIAGAIKFYSAMKKRGIKPILGCELYICDDDGIACWFPFDCHMHPYVYIYTYIYIHTDIYIHIYDT